MRSATRWRIALVRWAYTLAVVAMLLCPSPRDTSYRSAPGFESGCVGVAQVVEPLPRQAGPSQHRLEVRGHVARI